MTEFDLLSDLSDLFLTLKHKKIKHRKREKIEICVFHLTLILSKHSNNLKT